MCVCVCVSVCMCWRNMDVCLVFVQCTHTCAHKFVGWSEFCRTSYNLVWTSHSVDKIEQQGKEKQLLRLEV